MSISRTFDPSTYVLVSERIEAFKREYPRRAIQTEILRSNGEVVVVKATVWPDSERPECFFTGHAEEHRECGEVNSEGSAVENCETSAVGRALAFMGYPTERSGHAANGGALSEPAGRMINALCAGLQFDDAQRDRLVRQQFGARTVHELTEVQAQDLIRYLKELSRQPAPKSEVA